MYYVVKGAYEQMVFGLLLFGYLTTNCNDRFVLGVGCEYVCKKKCRHMATLL